MLRLSSLSLLALIGVLTLAPFVFAQDAGSTNFRSSRPTTNLYGGYGTSTSFSSVLSGGQTVTGEASSTNFILHTGIMYFDAYAPLSQNWRWYDDANNETPSAPLAAENTAPASVTDLNEIKLRITIAESASIGTENVKLRLQYSTSSIFSSGGYDVAEAWNCSGSSLWCYADGGGVDNAVITTGVLSDSDSCVASVGDGCGTHNESGTSTSFYTHPQGAVTEYEFTIQQSGAAPNTVYFFRVFDAVSSSTVPLNTGESYPSLSTEGGQLTFTIAGLEVATSTEGIITDVETTAVAVPFGTLPLNTPFEAAHRLTVSTNASAGYKIYTFQRQGFLGPTYEISPVTGTNDTPLGWSSGCTGGAAGCYGYHAGEDVLEGGSARFAANDTYARFTDIPSEVAYSAIPVTEKETDIVYRVEARQMQEAGSYSTTLVYIATPVF